jgi:hypothetical protein
LKTNETPKSSNLTLKLAVLQRLQTRSTWLTRSEIVQSLLQHPDYKNRPPIPLANGVSTAMHEIKADGKAAVASHGTLRFWHNIPDNKTLEDIMKTFDPNAMGIEDEKKPDLIMDKLQTRNEAVSPRIDEKAERETERTGIVEVAHGEPIGIVGADTLAELAGFGEEAFDDAIGYEIEALQHRLDNPIQYVGPVADRDGMVKALEGAARFFDRQTPGGQLSGKLGAAAELIRQLGE